MTPAIVTATFPRTITRSSAQAGLQIATLATADRTHAVLPQSDHAAHVEDFRRAWTLAILSFLQLPRARS